jgi:hypothetical protein
MLVVLVVIWCYKFFYLVLLSLEITVVFNRNFLSFPEGVEEIGEFMKKNFETLSTVYGT